MEHYFRKAAQGILLSFVVIFFIFAGQNGMIIQFWLHETLPDYTIDHAMRNMLRLNTGVNGIPFYQPARRPRLGSQRMEDIVVNTAQPLVGINDIIYQDETSPTLLEEYYYFPNAPFSPPEFDLTYLRELETLQRMFYVVNPRTAITPDLFDIDRFMQADLTIQRNPNVPQILIFHTHSTETFSDSQSINEGVIAVGAHLSEVLAQKYGIQSIHHTQSFDIVNGEARILGAYERMDPYIRRILEENPSIEIVIDLHRDGVRDDLRLIHDINGEPTAQIMFVNGLSRRLVDGELAAIYNLPNPYINTNLAFSFQMQLAAQHLYPGLMRRIYVNAFRYSLHMRPKSLLVEVGAQTNTLEEALRAVEPLAHILAHVVLPRG